MADISTLPTIDVVGTVPVSQRRSFIRVIELAFRNRAGNISKILDNGDLQSNQDKFVFINGNALVGSVPTFNSPNQEDTGDQLRVEFEFNKALDHSEDSDTGEIIIYGLSSETAETIGGVFNTVTCRVGYLDERNVTPLFTADIVDSKYEKTKGGTVTTLKVSSNVNDLFQGSRVSVEVPALDPKLDLKGESAAFDKFIADQILPLFADFLFDQRSTTLSITPTANKTIQEKYGGKSYSFMGTLKDCLDDYLRPIGLSYRMTQTEGKPEVLIFSHLDIPKESDKTAIVINEDTGLIGLPYLRSDTVSKSVNEETESNEAALQSTPKFRKDGTPKEAKKYSARRYGVGFSALLNPAVEPQTVVKIETKDGTTDGLYRVRNVKFKGDNFGNDFTMEVQCENSDKRI
jgi:hypothetical protein